MPFGRREFPNVSLKRMHVVRQKLVRTLGRIALKSYEYRDEPKQLEQVMWDLKTAFYGGLATLNKYDEEYVRKNINFAAIKYYLGE